MRICTQVSYSSTFTWKNSWSHRRRLMIWTTYGAHQIDTYGDIDTPFSSASLSIITPRITPRSLMAKFQSWMVIVLVRIYMEIQNTHSWPLTVGVDDIRRSKFQVYFRYTIPCGATHGRRVILGVEQCFSVPALRWWLYRKLDNLVSLPGFQVWNITTNSSSDKYRCIGHDFHGGKDTW